MKNYEVIIVGGGPSGASLGYLLQAAGVSNCIIEKKSFPRDKLCGGLLTEKTVSLLQKIYNTPDFPYERVTSQLNLFLGTHKLSSVVTDSRFFLVERREFDNLLIKKYKDAGGNIYENTKIKCIDETACQLELNTGVTLKYRILVGADGANSQVRKCVDPNYRPNAFCLEASCYSDSFDESIGIYFATIRNGYGWYFPKKNHYTIGIGGIIKKNPHLASKFECFARSLGNEFRKDQIQGAMIPFGHYVKKPAVNNILLVGDAAGLVDPITGEGIYFALKSSLYAHQAIVDGLQNGTTSLKRTYIKSVKKLHHIIEDANCFKRVYFSEFMQTRFLKMIDGKTNITKFLCDNVLAEYKTSYMQFPVVYYFVRRKRILQKKKVMKIQD